MKPNEVLQVPVNTPVPLFFDLPSPYEEDARAAPTADCRFQEQSVRTVPIAKYNLVTHGCLTMRVCGRTAVFGRLPQAITSVVAK